VPQPCDAAATPTSPSAKSLVIPTVSLPVQSAAQGEYPFESAQQPDRRNQGRIRGGLSPSVGGSRTSAEDLGSLFTPMNGELTMLCPDSESWIRATVAGGIGGLHKARAVVLRVTFIITRLSPWSRTGTIRSAWRSRAGFVKSAMLRWALYSDGSLARPQSAARIAVRICWGRRVKSSMPDRCRCISAALSIDGTKPP
jgi:hypothetical protein